MPRKYHIHVERSEPRFRPVGKLGIVDWREDCSNCHNCVKRSCVYGLYHDESETLREELGYLDYIYQCKGCLNCVQNCTKALLTRVVNPEYLRLGDEYFAPQILLSTWFQAATGSIPVSGAGYGGPFSGPGFDSMWTDMSEIVRPTRDGIHGREYINTSVDIGRKLERLSFRDGILDVSPPPLLENPMPLIFEAIPPRWRRGAVVKGVAKAATQLGLFAVVPVSGLDSVASLDPERIVPLVERPAEAEDKRISAARMVMIEDGEDAEVRLSLKKANPSRIVAVRVQATPRTAKRVAQLAQEEVEAIHIVFDAHGRETDAQEPRHVRDVLRETHRMLVKRGLRDTVTLISSGGIALPEHMAKAVICGADLVAIDLPLLVALECRLCGECGRGGICPVALEDINVDFAAQRVSNLMGAWRNQLLEMLGAMGIREARRLRGETGRAMFFEDLERQTFARLGRAQRQEVGAAGRAISPSNEEARI